VPGFRPIDRDALRQAVLALLTLGAAFLCVEIALPLAAPLTWAATLAVAFAPLHARVLRAIGQPSIAAAASSAAIAALTGALVVYVGGVLAQQAVPAAQALQELAANERWKTLAPLPWLEPAARWIAAQIESDANQDRALAGLAAALRRIASGSLDTVVGALVTLFFLFYFLRDHRRFVRAIARLSPLAPPETCRLLRDARDAIRATVYGTLAVAALQGTLGGLMFWWLGLPAPLLWGVVMTVLSILPIVGAPLVWIPAAAYLALTGHVGSAAILAAWGTLVIGLVDNLLKPLLVKRGLHAHAAVVFVAVLGGVYAFGASGVVLGPVVVAVASSLVHVWRRRLGRHDARAAGT
jgi:predicted PurR-regulated permease PerM